MILFQGGLFYYSQLLVNDPFYCSNIGSSHCRQN